jgi:hypothetical protein
MKMPSIFESEPIITASTFAVTHSPVCGLLLRGRKSSARSIGIGLCLFILAFGNACRQQVADDTPSIPCETTGNQWALRALETSGDTGHAPALVYDAAGHAHVVFSNAAGHLAYTTDASGEWSTRILATSGVQSGSWDLDLDPSGDLHVVYFGPALAYVHVGSEAIEVVDLPAATPTYRPSIVVDAVGVHIAYADYDSGGFGEPSGGVRLLSNATGSWVDESVFELAGEQDLAEGTDGSLHLVISEGNAIWETRLVDGEAVVFTEIANLPWMQSPRLHVDEAGTQHLVGWGSGVLLVYANDDGGWAVEKTFGDAAYPTEGSIHVGFGMTTFHGEVHLAWSAIGGRIHRATLRDSIWADSIVAPQRRGTGPVAVGIGSDGLAHVIYYDWNEGDLVHAVEDPCGDGSYGSELPTWTFEQVAPGRDWPNPPRQAETTVAVDPFDGSLHVAYAFSNNGCCPDIYYRSNRSGAWGSELTIEEQGNRYHTTPSLTIGPEGTVHLSFLSADGLKYARRTGNIWGASSLIEWAPGFETNQVLVGGDGHPHIIYSTGQQLRLAAESGDEWDIETIDPGTEGHSFMRGAATLDADGHLHSTYTDHYGELRYATNASGVWAIESVAATYGRSTLAAAASGDIHVLYGSGTLAYARRGAAWTREVLDSGDIGTMGLVLGMDERVEVAYGSRGGSLGSLRWTTNAGGKWLREIIAFEGHDPAVAMDNQGQMHVVYFDAEDGAIKHAIRQ